MAGMSDYRCPPASADEDRKAAWFRETVQAGEQWLKGQRAYKSIQDSMDLVLNGSDGATAAGPSHLSIPRSKRQIRELVSILANLRPSASNKTDNREYLKKDEVFNNSLL